MSRIVIVRVGMVTSVGLTADATATAVRAGIATFGESALHDRLFEPFTLAEVPEEKLAPLDPRVAALTGLTHREMRMARLAAPALAECLGPLAGAGIHPPLVLALPDMETPIPLDRPSFLGWLGLQAGDLFDLGRSDASSVGRAGGLLAIDHAAELIRLGRTNFALAGAVDTFRDPYVLSALNLARRVKTPTDLDGLIPGEGAAFLLLSSEAAAEKARLTPLATVGTLSQGVEPGHIYSEEPYRGDGLAMVITQLADGGALDAPVREVYSSMNGESYWAKEWGVALIRNSALFADDHGFHHPADCLGDTGAASGPVMAGLAALGMSHGYRAQPAVVYCSSDRGERAALAMSTV